MQIKNFIKETVKKNDGKIKNIAIFCKSDEKLFQDWYDKTKPDYVFLQAINPKGQIWNPIFDNSKIILFSWHMDGTSDLIKSNQNIVLNIVRHKKELIYFGKDIPVWMNISKENQKKINSFKTKFYGNIRKLSLSHNPANTTLNLLNSLKTKKVCFIAEAHIRLGDIKYFKKSTGACIDELIKDLKKNDYYIVWKKREKGFPKKDCSPLDFCNEKPDLIIEQDIHYPSTLFAIPEISNLNIVINTSSCIFDLYDISKKTIMVLTTNESDREKKYLDLRYKDNGYAIYNLTNQNDYLSFLNTIKDIEDTSVQSNKKEKSIEDVYEMIKKDVV